MSRRFERKNEDPGSEKDELSDEELLDEKGQALPDREAMSTIDADVAIPINPALAADVLSGMVEGDEAKGEEPEPAAESEEPEEPG